MLNNFFKINLPYGIAKNENGEWMAFNREYMPLGFNDLSFKEHVGYSYNDKPIYTKYKRMTENFLVDLVDSEKLLGRNEAGEIVKVFFYDDSTNPSNNSQEKLWKSYFDKIQKLAKMEKSDVK